MVSMVVVAIAVVVVLVVAGAVWLLRGRGGDDVQSVQGYRHALDTLQDIRSRSEGGTVRVLGPGQGVGAPGPEPPPRPTAERPSAPTGPRRPLVFDDAALPPPPFEAGAESGGRRDRAISLMNHRPRRLVGPIVVVVAVLAVLAVVVAIGARSHTAAPRRTSVTTTVPTHHTTTVPPRAPTTGARGGHPGGTRAPTTTTTTLPPVALVSSSANQETYSVPPTAYSLVVGASSGSCWVSVTGQGGQVLFTKTLTGGENQTVQANGQVTIVIGAPSVVQLSVNGVPLTLPSGYQTPFNMILQPGAAPGGSTTTSTPTTSAPAGA